MNFYIYLLSNRQIRLFSILWHRMIYEPSKMFENQ